MRNGKSVQNRVAELIAQKQRQTGQRITYADVAAATGLSEVAIGKWSRNEVTRFDRKMIATFCEYFDCTVGELLVYEDRG
jgi:putative transcriptional regulator